MTKTSSTAKLDRHTLSLGFITIAMILFSFAIFILDDIHAFASWTAYTLGPPPGTGGSSRIDSARAPSMGRAQHGAAAVDAIIHNEEIIVPRKLMLVDAMETPLVWSGAEPIASRDEAC